MWTLWSFSLLCLIVTCCALLIQVGYNIYCHPLRKFPGPRHFAATAVPYVYASFTGRLATRLYELHLKYGPVVRTAPNELSFISSAAWPTIYGRNNQSKQPFRKNYDSFNETRSQIRRSLYLACEEEHAQARKTLSHAFSPDSLRRQEVLLQRHVQDFLQVLERERQTGPVDLEKWFTRIAFDMIADTSFGEPFNSVREPKDRAWPLMLSTARKAITAISGIKNIMPSVSCLRWLPFSQSALLQRTVLQSVVDKMKFDLGKVESRIVSSHDRGDLLSAILRETHQKRSLDTTEVLANASLFILAGTETVASLLCAVTYFLTENPAALARLIAEVRRDSDNEEDLTIHNTSNMTYLTACLEEALRLAPPVPEGLPRVTPPGGEFICDYWVPGGVAVQVSTLAATWSPTNFTRPLSFEPERWLGNSSNLYPFDDPQASQPFSMGPRNCIGQSLAMAEVRLIISHLLRNYDIEGPTKSASSAPEKEPRDSHTLPLQPTTYLLWEREPLYMTLRKRMPVADQGE